LGITKTEYPHGYVYAEHAPFEGNHATVSSSSSPSDSSPPLLALLKPAFAQQEPSQLQVVQMEKRSFLQWRAHG
jgi:hypothetical protein